MEEASDWHISCLPPPRFSRLNVLSWHNPMKRSNTNGWGQFLCATEILREPGTLPANSATQTSGTYEATLVAGTYMYPCSIHGGPGTGMWGKIVVL